jgi:folate-binding protein YgfZ
MFSAEQYRQLREGVGLVSRPDRGLLSFAGADHADFLQGQLTNDVAALEAGTGCYAALLTANGRMIADMRVFETGDRLLMDVGADQAASLRERFDQMIFTEDVRVEDVSAAFRQLGVYGPGAARMIEKASGDAGLAQALEGLALHSSRDLAIGQAKSLIVRSRELGVDGFDLFVPAAVDAAVLENLLASGAALVDRETAEVTRIEAGHPLFHVDMDEETIPLEAGIEDRAISQTKGCYVGQEIIIRVLHRGHGRVAKRLVGLTLAAGAPVPTRGDAIVAGDKPIGSVTSATLSPALGRAIALGYVHRDSATPSTRLTIGPGGGHDAVVTALPFVSAAAASAR